MILASRLIWAFAFAIPVHSYAQWGGSRSDTIGVPPLHSIRQHMPCKEQLQSFKAAVTQYDHLATPSTVGITGTWVAIGFLNDESSTNCAGVVRGPAYELILDIGRDSLSIDMLAMPPMSVVAKRLATGELAFPLEDGGDDVHQYRCRLTIRRTLLCLDRKIGWGLELAKKRVDRLQRASSYSKPF